MSTDPGASTAPDAKPERAPITVSKPTPYTFDLGFLLAQDPNPLDLPSSVNASTPLATAPLNAALNATARDGAQALLNQLITTCPVTTTPASAVLLTLPARQTAVPRHKPLPTPKPPTKWDLFARKKGIGKYNPLAKKKGRLIFDEASGEWVPRHGFKPRKKDADGQNQAQDDWLVELDDKQWRQEQADAAEGNGRTVRGAPRRERKERIKRAERKMRANERRAAKAKA